LERILIASHFCRLTDPVGTVSLVDTIASKIFFREDRVCLTLLLGHQAKDRVDEIFELLAFGRTILGVEVFVSAFSLLVQFHHLADIHHELRAVALIQLLPKPA